MEHSGVNTELFFLVLLVCAIGYSLLSKAISRSLLTLPIIFVVVGYLLSEPIKTLGIYEQLDGSKQLLAEITLILVLFSDASHVRFQQFRKNFRLPVRMLVLGLPMTMVLGTAVVYFLVPGTTLAMALLTAAVLTPTDAALGQTVVTSPDVPQHLSESINVESGLNDGLVLPFVLLGAILASAGMDSHAQTERLAYAAIIQVILGPLVGIAVGWLSAKALDFAQDRDLIVEAAQGVVFLATAFASYLVAEVVGGNGFIAAFVAGIFFGNIYKHNIHFISEFMEGAGQILTMISFLAFGAFLLPIGFAHMIPETVFLAICFLTFVRMLPIWLSLWGTGIANYEKFFVGWFGPRGLASILFTLIVVDEFELPNEQELLACVSLTVFLSIFLHGLSATPLARVIGRAYRNENDQK